MRVRIHNLNALRERIRQLREELAALRVYERAALAAERVRLEPDPSREAANAKRRERRQTSAGKAQSENQPPNA